jgi:pimeloyl-ACP methyl ester carboxylesterase
MGVRIIAPERPGYGLSTPNPKRGIHDWSKDVKELANHLQIGRFHVMGESGGGPYVLICAAQMGKQVISATLIGSVCPTEVQKSLKNMSISNRVGFFLARRTPFIMKLLSASFESAIKKQPEKVMKRLVSQLCVWDKQIIENAGEAKQKILTQHFREAFRQGSEGHYSDTLLISRPWGIDFSSITVPVFMWHGEMDTLMPIAPVKEFAKLLPNCVTHFLPDAGHFLLESEEIGIHIITQLLSIKA